MKVSYSKRFGPDGTVYRQQITMSAHDFIEIANTFMDEIRLGMPNKNNYVQTSGYEMFMTVPEATNVSKGNWVSFLNLTQVHFMRLNPIGCRLNNETLYKIKTDRNTMLVVK